MYSLVICLALPLIFLRLAIRSLRVPAYRQRWLERLGINNLATTDILVHAVSVGEVVAALPLIASLRQQHPNRRITFTTTTPTGSQRLRQSLGNSVQHVYMPYDLPCVVDRFLKKLKPRVLIIIETELWPNLLHACQVQSIPALIVNGRISDRSLRGYLRIRYCVQRMLQQISFIAAQSAQDMQRFVQLGMEPSKVTNCGNLKFDVQLNSRQSQAGEELRANFVGRQVWVAASTHDGEEQIILDVFSRLLIEFPDLLLILVPRHPDRFNQVANLLEQNKLRYVRRSSAQACDMTIKVILGDSMGELNVFYAAADIAFVGGSLLPIGGHNLLEPAIYGLPVVTGVYTTNFQEITDKLLDADAVLMVQNSVQLYLTMLDLLNNHKTRLQLGARALEVVERNRGAVQRVSQIITAYLDRS